MTLQHTFIGGLANQGDGSGNCTARLRGLAYVTINRGLEQGLVKA